MFLRLITCVLLISMALSLTGQTGIPKKVDLYYQISAAETLALLKEKDFDPSPKYFHTLVQPTILNNKNTPELPDGNYLKVSNQNENLVITLLLQSAAEVDLIDAKKYLYFNPANIPEIERASAQIWLDGKLLKWHEPTQHFRWKKKKRKKNIKLVAKMGDQVVYETLEQNERYPYRRGFWSRLNPIRWVRNLPYKIENTIEKIKDPDYSGYVVLNKPEYRPGDTLKMKAYFVDKKGHFPERPLLLNKISKYYTRNNAIPLYPDQNGNFTHEIILHDSLNLELNRNYGISFQGKYLRNFRTYFQYKDYQLDEVDYQIKAKKRSFFYGDTVKFTANAFYKNGLRVKDARVKILLLPPDNLDTQAAPSLFLKDEVVIQDTLWRWEQALDTRQPTEIIVPDSVLPAAAFSYQVYAVFTNANGEISGDMFSFRIKNRKENVDLDCFSIALEGKELIVENNCSNRSDLHQINMYQYVNYRLEQKIITLPYREKIGNQNYAWNFFDRDSVLIKSFELNKIHPEVNITGVHTGDSVHIQVRNPRELDILWEWYENKKLKTAAKAIPKGNFFSRKADRNKSYYLKYYYKWNGNINQQELALKFYENQLDMQVIHPKLIQPGATVAVKVKVKDGNGKNAANINLTALSINDRFDNSRINGPKIKVGPFKEPKEKPKYQTTKAKRKSSKTIDQQWIKELGLSEELFYKIQYPNGLFLHYEKIKVLYTL